MSAPAISLERLIDTLRAERLLPSDVDTQAILAERRASQPWYVRALVGFGAWLASLLLIGFVTSLSLLTGEGYGIVGGLLIAGATLVRYRTDGDFLIQCAMASSLAGQALLAYNVADAAGHGEFEIFLGFTLAMGALLFLVYPDRIHRVLMLLLATGSLIGLLYRWEANALVPWLGPLLAAFLILLQRRLPRLATSRYAPLLTPLTSGLMLGACASLMLSTVYLLPELGSDFRFYPRPWISTLLLGVELLYLCRAIWPVVAASTDTGRLAPLYGLTLLVIAAAWYAPGLVLGLIILLLGVESGRASFVGAGIGFFTLFLAAFFYGIETSLLVKAITLVCSGLAVLLGRWIILKFIARDVVREADHA